MNWSWSVGIPCRSGAYDSLIQLNWPYDHYVLGYDLVSMISTVPSQFKPNTQNV